MAVVNQIVTAHGGTITAKSEGKDLGATLIVRLPRLSEGEGRKRSAGADDNSPMADLQDIRILVVEDNDDARALIQGVLTGTSANVLAVAGVDAALGSLKTFSPDLLVGDVGMPEQDGYDLIRRLRDSGWPAEMLPAIALTAFARDEDRRRALDAGYQSHFTKPLDARAFLAEVRRLVDDRGPVGAR